MILRVEQQEPPAPRAHELAADGAILQRQLVPLVDLRVAHAARPALLLLPLIVHQRPESRGITLHQRVARAEAQRLHLVQVLQHPGVALFTAGLLVGEDAARAAREAGEEQQQVVLQVEQRVHRHLERLGVHGAVGMEREAGHATVGGDVLVLLAHRFAQAVDLDVAGQLGQLARVQQAFPVRVQRLQQRRREAPR
jgi:hypothetical protein